SWPARQIQPARHTSPKGRPRPASPHGRPRPDRYLVPDLRKQSDSLAAADHARRGSQPPRGLRDAHGGDSNNFLSRKPVPACIGPPRPSSVEPDTNIEQGKAEANKEIACPWSTRSPTCRWPPSAARRSSWPNTRCRGSWRPAPSTPP